MRNTGRRTRVQPIRKYYELNYRIQAPELRVIDSMGKMIGILTRDVAIEEAKKKEMDVVLIAPHAKPPVAKIVNFKKFLYSEEKKAREAKKGLKKSVVKDISLSLFVGPADFDRFVRRTQDFLKMGNQVRVNLTLRGREMGKKPMAFDLMKRFLSKVENASVSKEPKLDGRVIRAVLAKKK